MGKPSQAKRSHRLFQVFNRMTLSIWGDIPKTRLVYKYINEEWDTINPDSPEVTEENFDYHYRKTLTDVLSNQALNSSLESINIIKALEEYEIYHYKQLNDGDSSLTNVAFAIAKQFHPVFDKCSKLIDTRKQFVEKINETVEEGEYDVTILSKLVKDLPGLSIKVINTRSFYKILAAQARFVKIVIALGRNDLENVQKLLNTGPIT